jgi:hypothetical protein
VAYDGSDYAAGNDALNILSIGEAVVQDIQFGIICTTAVLEGILDVSFTEIESLVNVQEGSPMITFQYCLSN